MMGMHEEHMRQMEQMHGEEGHEAWTYYAGHAEAGSPVQASVAAKSGRKAARTITNQDVERMSEKNQEFKRGKL
jgi:hypothetical protein